MISWTTDLYWRNFSTNILFALNETTKTVSIPIIDDTDVEPNETILLSLSDPGGGASLGSRSNAVLTITDNDMAVQFSSDIYTNNETAGAAVVTIVRSGPLTSMVTVTLRTIDRWAVPLSTTTDCTAGLAVTVNIAAFEVAVLKPLSKTAR